MKADVRDCRFVRNRSLGSQVFSELERFGLSVNPSDSQTTSDFARICKVVPTPKVLEGGVLIDIVRREKSSVIDVRKGFFVLPTSLCRKCAPCRDRSYQSTGARQGREAVPRGHFLEGESNARGFRRGLQIRFAPCRTAGIGRLVRSSDRRNFQTVGPR